MNINTKTVVIDGPGQNGDQWLHRTVELENGRPVRFRDSGPGWSDQGWSPAADLKFGELTWPGCVVS